MSDKELNAWIAEKLMGWTDVWLSATDARGKPPDRHGHFVVPAFSTDLALAFEVVERMRERGIYLSVMTSEDGYYVRLRSVVVPVWKTPAPTVKTLAEVPRLICVAAKAILEKSK